MNFRRLAALAIAGLGSQLISPVPRAHAESAARPCYRDAEVLPRTTGSVPAGAPGVVFVPAAFASERPIGAYELELRGPSGDVIAHTLEVDGPAYVLLPATVLGVGRHEVRFTDLCNFYVPTQKRTAEVKVETAFALPTTLGAVARDITPIVQFDGNNEPKCQPAQVDITFVVQLSPELAAYKDVARYQVAYKGKSRTFSYGYAYAYGNRVQLEVEDSCNLREAVGGEVTVSAHVAGAATDPPPLTFQLSATCPGIGPDPKPPQDAGPTLPMCGAIPDAGVEPEAATMPDADTTSDVVATSDSPATPPDTAGAHLDAGAPIADTSTSAPSSSSGGAGCQISSRRPREGALWLLLLPAVFVRRRALSESVHAPSKRAL